MGTKVSRLLSVCACPFPQMEGKRAERHRRQVQPGGEGDPGGAGWKMEVVVKQLSSSLGSAAIHPQAPFSTET